MCVRVAPLGSVDQPPTSKSGRVNRVCACALSGSVTLEPVTFPTTKSSPDPKVPCLNVIVLPDNAVVARFAKLWNLNALLASG